MTASLTGVPTPHLCKLQSLALVYFIKESQHNKYAIVTVNSYCDAKGRPPSSYAMVDPLSVLGAAIGVTSLIIQLTDKCVKGRKPQRYGERANILQAINSTTKQPTYPKPIATFSCAFTSNNDVSLTSHSRPAF
jgi:hypothetical protein